MSLLNEFKMMDRWKKNFNFWRTLFLSVSFVDKSFTCQPSERIVKSKPSFARNIIDNFIDSFNENSYRDLMITLQ